MNDVLIAFILFFFFFSIGCDGNHSNDKDVGEYYSDEEIAEEENEDETYGYEDGTYSANVEYYNPEADYSATYTLKVKVEDNEVVEIDFPKGGWLDEDHISPAELDEYGQTTVEGEDGKTYEIEID
ncbi:MAG: hypothetical protein WBC06_19195 [Chitinophagaceae bacterium]